MTGRRKPKSGAGKAPPPGASKAPPPGGGKPAKDRQGETLMVVRVPKVKSLVVWSGGLDSTYALVRLLRETEDEVFAHHIHFRGRNDAGDRVSHKCEYETQAIARLRPYIERNYRPFTYSESWLDISAFKRFARDTATAMFFAAQAAMSYGFTPRDRIILGINRDEDVRWMPGTDSYRYRRMMTVRMLKAVFESEEVPYFFLFEPRPSKQEEADFLPYELFGLTVSCRDPVLADGKFETCGACLECRTLKTVVRKPDPAPATEGGRVDTETA